MKSRPSRRRGQQSAQEREEPLPGTQRRSQQVFFPLCTFHGLQKLVWFPNIQVANAGSNRPNRCTQRVPLALKERCVWYSPVHHATYLCSYGDSGRVLTGGWTSRKTASTIEAARCRACTAATSFRRTAHAANSPGHH